MDRREFIKSSSLAAGVFVAPSFYISRSDYRLKVGIVGTGWFGGEALLPSAIKTGQFEVVGLCDVDSARLQKVSEGLASLQKTKAKLFKHYQDLYHIKGLDAVIIATPVHWHALQFIDACKKKLPVFLEKPVFYDIREGQMMMKAAKEALNITKVNFIRLKSPAYKEVKEYIQSGKAGKIYQVEAQLHFPSGDLVEKPIPASLDYDLWCGPAPMSPYLCPSHSDVINWRAIDSYCHGHFYDWGIHHINTIRHVMNLDMPTSVSAMGGNTRYKTITTPDYLTVQFDFNYLPVSWSHRIWGSAQFNDETTDGILFYGEKETVFLRDWGWSVIPTDPKGERKTVGKLSFEFQNLGSFVEAQMAEFAKAIKEMKPESVSSPIEDAFKTTAAVNLADIAYKSKAMIEFDSANMRITNSEKANNLLKREYRKPYQHPYV